MLTVLLKGRDGILLLNLPNFLTLIRIASIPFFLVLLSAQLYWESFIVFIIGGLTDFLDGLVARLMNQQTAIGAYLDPVADKLLVMSSFVMLGLADALPAWIAVIVVSRDILILVGYGIIYLLLDERPKVEPSIIGKLSTLLQLVTVGAILLLLANPQMLDLLVKDLLIGAMAVATVWSGLQYLYRGLMWLQNRGPSLSQLG